MRNLGHTIVGACEIDKYARSVYAKQFPGVTIWENATTIKPKEIPDFEILCAGFPCQSFSIAGQRRGFDDTRGSLFFEIARIAKEKRPRYLLLENVKGLLSHDKGKTLHTIISTLDEIGYDVQWQVINSKYFVPQNRERIFIVGHLRGKGRGQIFPLGDNDEKTGGENNLKQLNKTNLYAVVNDQRTMIVADRSRSYAGKGRNLESPKDISNSLTSVTKDNYVATFVYLSNTNANMKQRTQDRKETWTLGTGTDFGIKDGIKIRRLTPLECERLQGFPDEWTKYDIDGNILSDTQRYKMCGNAVTVSVVQYIGENF
tara:strand:- start:205 stop:1152 length:948 start_codon:yes stop_codon:yes gene_type:complete